MAKSFATGALLGHVYTLGDGLPVRLRLARSSDAAAIKALLARQGQTGDLDVARLVHFDPRRRYVLFFIGLVDATETLLGVGAISLDGATEPELLVTEAQRAQELSELLRRALLACALARAA
jgi:hypothetical protein